MTFPSDRALGGLLVAGFEGTRPSEEVRRLIAERSLGGVILYGKNCADPGQVLELTNALQSEAREAGAELPLFVAVDQEQGRVVRLREGVTLFPPMGALARLDDPALVEGVARAVSRELDAVGVNWNLAPVADVLSEPSCPVGDRSFGADPATVAAMVTAWIRGADGEGMIGSLKHFPGHGATGLDSHVAAPRVERTREELERVDIAPFRDGIGAGIPTVMTAHITFPAFDPDLPATFSPKVISGLLRGDLGFGGVVVSDDLEMAGASGMFSISDGGRAALGAGVDALIVSGMLLPERDLPGLLDDLERAAAGGELPGERIEAARTRVRRLKERYLDGRWSRERGAAESLLRSEAHLALLEEVRERLAAIGERW